MSDHRWQGYGHTELFEQINAGPGPDSSTDPVRRWSELIRALGEIDDDLAKALRSAMSDWQGSAAENARGGLRPLGEWAAQAQQAATIMRERAESQAEFISRARRDMPPPVPVTIEDPGTAETLLTHLFGGQTDYERQEARQAAAEQRAFDVMRTYESSTEANTTSLATFTPPPQVVVDSGVAGGGATATPERGVTLGWTAAPASSVTGGPSTGTGVSVHPTVSPTAPSTTAHAGSTSTSGARKGTGNAPRMPGNGSGAPHDAEEVADETVTEEVGQSGGFFDVPQTGACPVIGAESPR